MRELTKGSKTTLPLGRYSVQIDSVTAGQIDIIAVLLASDGKVRSDSDLVFFNNPAVPGVQLRGQVDCVVDLSAVPVDIDRVVIAASTEAQNLDFQQAGQLSAHVDGPEQFTFTPLGLGSETVLQLIAFYRRSGMWKIDAIGQGYSLGLAAFATDFGIAVDDEVPVNASPASSPQQPKTPPSPHGVAPVNMSKVKISITKDSPVKTASIDLRKGGPGWILTVGLEWDGRGAEYAADGRVKSYGEGDLDVYFFCRDEVKNKFVILSGESGHTGTLGQWPFIQHHGDSKGPGNGDRPAVEQVTVLPQENGDLLVNVYQSVDNGIGAINTFGKPRVAIRYGRPGPDGLPGSDSDEILVFVGNSQNSYWATVAHIDVEGGVLTVDGKTRYSDPHSETMPTLNRWGNWVKSAAGAPVGQSKSANGMGLDRYSGKL